MKIIEIGAAVIEVNSAKILNKLQLYIQPVVNPQLTPFCINLTGIEQSDVENAPYFYDALNQFSDWLSDQTDLIGWASWGAYDRNQFEQDCKRHQQSNPLTQFNHLNLKTAYAAATQSRSKGMANAFKEQNQDMIGSHHSGLDDAINIARLIKLTPNFHKHVKAIL